MSKNHFSDYTSSYYSYSYSDDYQLDNRQSKSAQLEPSVSIEIKENFSSTKSRFINSNPYTHGLFSGTKTRIDNLPKNVRDREAEYYYGDPRRYKTG